MIDFVRDVFSLFVKGDYNYADIARKINLKNVPMQNYNQKDLWKFGISGDLPIIVVKVKDANDIYIVKEMLKAYQFIRSKNLDVEIVFIDDESKVPKNAVSLTVDDLKVFIPFEELVDIEEEIKRLEGEKTKLEAEVLRGEKMLSNPGFINKAPEAKVNEEKAKLENYKQMLQNVEERLASLK